MPQHRQHPGPVRGDRVRPVRDQPPGRLAGRQPTLADAQTPAHLGTRQRRRLRNPEHRPDRHPIARPGGRHHGWPSHALTQPIAHRPVPPTKDPAARVARVFQPCHRPTRLPRRSDAGIPYRIPAADDLTARLTEALTVIYLLFNEGYLSTGGRQAQSRDLADDAEFLATLLHTLMPAEPEVAGLLALIRLHRARATARFDGNNEIIQLPQQDRSRWDHQAIADAGRLIARAAAIKRPGPYQLQAAIVACHAEAGRWEDTDWTHIVVLYDMLLHLAPSPVIRLHRAIALRYVTGPAAALSEVDTLVDDLNDYHLFHATRAELLRDLDQPDRARADDQRALDLTTNPAEQTLLRQRLHWR
jgi:predicted RNA polymerase sigma factor